MRNASGLFKKVCVLLMAFGVVVFNSALVFAEAKPGELIATNIPTDLAIGNITLVGIAMIGVVLVKFGIKAAKSMIN